MKSIVVELKNDFAAVLSDDGSIIKVKNKNYVVGQVIELKTQKVPISKKLVLSVASAAVLFLSVGTGTWAYTAPYSYVSLDVNPSIEYVLNRFDRVIDVNAINDDGQVILDEIKVNELTNQSIDDAITQTVEQISENGYFNHNPEESMDGGIVITVANENMKLSEDLSNEIRDTVEAVVEDTVIIEVSSVTYDQVQEAKDLGITPGKLNLIQKLQASSINPDSIVIEEWINKPVKEIMKTIKANKKAAETDESNVTESSTLDDSTTAEVDKATAETDDLKENDADTEDASNKNDNNSDKADQVKSQKEKASEQAKVDALKASKKAKREAEKASEQAKREAEKASKQKKEKAEKAKQENETGEEKAKSKDSSYHDNNSSSNSNKKN